MHFPKILTFMTCLRRKNHVLGAKNPKNSKKYRFFKKKLKLPQMQGGSSRMISRSLETFRRDFWAPKTSIKLVGFTPDFTKMNIFCVKIHSKYQFRKNVQKEDVCFARQLPNL